MKTFDEIKQLMAAGDTAQADEALKELLAKEPEYVGLSQQEKADVRVVSNGVCLSVA